MLEVAKDAVEKGGLNIELVNGRADHDGHCQDDPERCQFQRRGERVPPAWRVRLSQQPFTTRRAL